MAIKEKKQLIIAKMCCSFLLMMRSFFVDVLTSTTVIWGFERTVPRIPEPGSFGLPICLFGLHLRNVANSNIIPLCEPYAFIDRLCSMQLVIYSSRCLRFLAPTSFAYILRSTEGARSNRATLDFTQVSWSYPRSPT